MIIKLYQEEYENNKLIKRHILETTNNIYNLKNIECYKVLVIDKYETYSNIYYIGETQLVNDIELKTILKLNSTGLRIGFKHINNELHKLSPPNDDDLKQLIKENNLLINPTYTKVNNKIKLLDLDDRMYDYGCISNFTKPTKNIEESLNFLADKENVILIGKNSKNYCKNGWTCLELSEIDKVMEYYKKIKHLVQDSHYDPYSNVIADKWTNNC